ncbi:b(0,+)-type amino acid transporter 1 [Exaiptasia diaphana]|uniref:b(0,+)-type amino acid transporter 1 n=1 Tax=Exaiptasia diaphana TaxID=2652724 RepID=A0A913WU34_EXADI|nr:b(0,+)-type amino acid transporter 1 [Exaiptasia diaphana]KXJ17864.1 b(0,+)-type amino acid transporter 1 [Exaiptasia diaphana]
MAEKDTNSPSSGEEDAPASKIPLKPPIEDPEVCVEGKVELKKRVTLLSGISFIVGTVIGSGIFVSPTGILGMSNSIGLSLIVWLGCGILAMLSSLCYTELGTAVQKSGAEYAYLKEAFGPIPAFLFAWTGIIINRPAICAIVSLIFAEYVSKPFFPTCQPPEAVVKLLGLSCVVVVTGINCWSVRWATRVQRIFTFAKLLCIGMLVIIGIVELAKGKTENLQNAFEGSQTDPAKIGFAFYIGLWAYDGWNTLNYCTEEMKNPARDMPRAIVIGVSIITICYLIVNVAYITVLGGTGILASEAVAVSISNAYLGPVSWIIPLFVAASTFGTVNGVAFTSGRLTYVAARDGLLPSLLAMIQVKRLTPLPSMLLTSTIAICMLLPPGSNFMSLVGFFSFAAWLFYGGSFAALLWLRYSKPDMPRPYRVPIYIPIFMLLASIYLVIAPIVDKPLGSLIALAIILAGLPFYFFFKSKYVPQWFKDAVDSFTYGSQKLFDIALTEQCN